MTSNIETICELTDDDAKSFQRILPTFRRRLTPVAANVFTAYVDVAADAISKPFEGPIEEDEEMNAAIDLAEEALRESLTGTAPQAPSIPPVEIQHFLDCCVEEKSTVSREIMERIKGKYNPQGHVKHCYYGALRFLAEFPEMVAELAGTPRNSLYDFTNEDVLAKWRDFLHRHASDIDKERGFSFRTLRVYLPPNLAGICSGGGGGSGTLKRVLPVVARMLQISGKKDA